MLFEANVHAGTEWKRERTATKSFLEFQAKFANWMADLSVKSDYDRGS